MSGKARGNTPVRVRAYWSAWMRRLSSSSFCPPCYRFRISSKGDCNTCRFCLWSEHPQRLIHYKMAPFPRHPREFASLGCFRYFYNSSPRHLHSSCVRYGFLGVYCFQGWIEKNASFSYTWRQSVSFWNTFAARTTRCRSRMTMIEMKMERTLDMRWTQR